MHLARLLLLHQLHGRRAGRNKGQVANGRDALGGGLLLRHHPVVVVVRPLEDVHHAVVIALRDGIVFVAVATRAPDGQPHHAGAQNVHLIRDHIQPVLDRVGRAVVGRIRTHAQKTGGDDVVGEFRRDGGGVFIVGQFIARDLLR